MGLFLKLIGLAAAAGAGYAAVKIVRKYDENKQNEVMDDDFDSTKKESAFDDLKKAATDVYVETTQKVKSNVVNTAENIGIDTAEVGEVFGQVGSAAVGVGKVVAHSSAGVAKKIKTEAPVAIDKAKEKVGVAAEAVKETVSNVGEKINFKKSDVVDAEIYADDEIIEEDFVDEAEEVVEEVIEEVIEEVVEEEATEEITEDEEVK